MANIAILIGRASIKALAFTSSSYVFLRLFKDTIDTERKRHDLATEQFQKAHIEWVWKRQEQINFINKQLRLFVELLILPSMGVSKPNQEGLLYRISPL